MKEHQRRVLSSQEVFELVSLFKDRLCKLLEDSVHISAMARPQTLQETNMAAVTGDEQGQVGVLLHCLHWNGFKTKYLHLL